MAEPRTLRSSKRRKVSDTKWAGSSRGREDTGADRDIFDVPSDSDEGRRNRREESAAIVNGNNTRGANGKGNLNKKKDRNGGEREKVNDEEDPFDVVLKETPGRERRKATRKAKTEENADKDEGEDEEGLIVEETPTRRSSRRARKSVQKVNGESTPIDQLPTRRALFTPSNSTRKKESTPSSSAKKSNTNEKKQRSVRSRRSARQDAVSHDASDEDNEVVSDKADDRELEINGQPIPQPVDEDGDDIAITQQLHQEQIPEEDEPSTQTEVLPEYAEELKTYCERKGLEEHLGWLSGIVLEKLTGKRLIPLKGLQNEYQKVHQLVEHTVVSGEGNSMLLIGARGCGKTMLVETALSSLRKEHKDDFYVVRLNGFLHTDDRIALREIWRQLGREMDVDDSMVKMNNYADTMASLLALLSHPEELYGRSGDPDVIQTAKSVIIVLDEFDLFASHARQTLLYNLFDIAQARKAPLAVLGITTKVDVAENLEKRVKSRYSHRYVFLPRPRTFETFSEVCKAGLALEQNEIAEDPGNSPDQEANAELLKSGKGKKLVDGWGQFLQGLWQDSDFQHHLQGIYYTTKSPKDFYSSALLPMMGIHHGICLQHKLQIPTPNTFTIHSLSCPDPAPLPFPPTSTSTSSTSTTSLPLSLLLSATRLTALHDPGLNSTSTSKPTSLNLSFSIAYTEYVRLLTSAKASASASGVTATAGRVWGRDVARDAWGKLVKWGILVPVGSGAANAVEDGGGGLGGGGMEDGKMYRAEVSFEEVVDLVGVGGSLGRWWRDG